MVRPDSEHVEVAFSSPLTLTQRAVKRTFDLVIAIPAVIVLSPLLLAVFLVVFASSRGGAIYRAQRVGYLGEMFTMYKFRTLAPTSLIREAMIVGATDERVTRVGRFLRTTKIDELPQFFNVIEGTMSLVGPRPQTTAFIDHYSAEQRAVLTVRPGITGPGTVVNYERMLTASTPEENEELYFSQVLPERLEAELHYINSWTLSTDLRILSHTVSGMLSRDNDRRTTPLLHGSPKR